jgi:hypothetical protein
MTVIKDPDQNPPGKPDEIPNQGPPGHSFSNGIGTKTAAADIQTAGERLGYDDGKN